jgi:alkanesulfonate monooxygenase SsuD/methylene tetrahydromethanopterin reductase-like flavin-dependent oxidoreductase (luciferase family)
VTFRPAALLIKAVTTLDVLSGGRAWLGVGAGYHTAEAGAMGLPLPPAAERFEVLADTLALARQMWAGDSRAFRGRRITAGHPVSQPRAASVPRPRVLVGGAGERKTLRLVAEFGDACNLFDIPDGGQTLRRKLSVLEQHCAAIGRPFAEIDKTVSTRFDPAEPTADFVARCRSLAALGIDHVVCITIGPWTTESVARLAVAAGELG